MTFEKFTFLTWPKKFTAIAHLTDRQGYKVRVESPQYSSKWYAKKKLIQKLENEYNVRPT